MSEEDRVPTPVHSPSEKEVAPSEQLANGPTPEERRAVALGRMMLFGAVFAAISAGSFLVLYLRTGAWQVLVDVAGILLGALCLAPARWSARRGRLDTAGYWILLALVIVYGTGELVWSDATLPLAVSVGLLILLVASVLRPRRWGVWLAAAILYGIYVFLVNWLEPLPRYPILASSPVTQLINIPLALAVLWQAIRVFRIGTIRTRLISAFMATALLSVAAVSVGSIVLGFRSGQQQVIRQLESVATLKEAEISTWLDRMQSDLAAVLIDEDNSVRLDLLLSVARDYYDVSYQSVRHGLRTSLGRLAAQMQHFEELFLMDLNGQVILSTDEAQEGKIYAHEAFFQRGLEDIYVEPPFYSPSLDRSSIVAARPIMTQGGEVVGVLAGRANLEVLSEIMRERAGLGESGETYLVGADRALLTALRSGEEGIYVRTEGTDAAIENRTNGYAVYDAYHGASVIGVYRWLPDLQVALLAEQERGEALAPVYVLLGLNAALALVCVLAAGGISFFIARGIGTPLASLAGTAERIAAGDLERTAEVGRRDEIGALAQAFNSMTSQLRDLIAGLEGRVAARTRDLEQRSRYLEAAAEVAHAASSVLDAEDLMRRVVEFIRERFDLYYVGLFAVDETGEWAVLRAGTGEAGRAMLARGHRLAVGAESMIGWSVANAQARIALDVGQDAVRLATAELPDTRSEAALPLRSRGQVIGALTVQSDRPAAFDQDAIVVLQTMADQVAVALDNARLFAESQATLETVRRAYGELTREAWGRLLRSRSDLGYRSTERGLAATDRELEPAIETAVRLGETIQGDGSGGAERRTLTVPVKVRGTVVAVLDTYKPVGGDDWTSQEVELLETLADQLAVALESARLYEDAQRRAVRERMTREITERMRRSADVEEIIQTALDELSSVIGTSHTFVRLRTTPSPQDDGKDQ
jgi:GAF domain-containing protein/HAMP domain-containing protein